MNQLYRSPLEEYKVINLNFLKATAIFREISLFWFNSKYKLVELVKGSLLKLLNDLFELVFAVKTCWNLWLIEEPPKNTDNSTKYSNQRSVFYHL